MRVKQGQVGQWVRRVDRRTNALPNDQPTNQPTDRPTDTASYRGALSHLKTYIMMKNQSTKIKKNTLINLHLFLK